MGRKGIRMRTGQVYEEGKFGKQEEATIGNTFSTILSIIPQKSWVKNNLTLELFKDFFGWLTSTNMV